MYKVVLCILGYPALKVGYSIDGCKYPLARYRLGLVRVAEAVTDSNRQQYSLFSTSVPCPL